MASAVAAEYPRSISLTSPEIQDELAGQVVVLTGANSGNVYEFQVTPDLLFQSLDGGDSIQYEVLKNGVLCTVAPDRRFCYRVHKSDEGFEFWGSAKKDYDVTVYDAAILD